MTIVNAGAKEFVIAWLAIDALTEADFDKILDDPTLAHHFSDGLLSQRVLRARVNPGAVITKDQWEFVTTGIRDNWTKLAKAITDAVKAYGVGRTADMAPGRAVVDAPYGGLTERPPPAIPTAAPAQPSDPYLAVALALNNVFHATTMTWFDFKEKFYTDRRDQVVAYAAEVAKALNQRVKTDPVASLMAIDDPDIREDTIAWDLKNLYTLNQKQLDELQDQLSSLPAEDKVNRTAIESSITNIKVQNRQLKDTVLVHSAEVLNARGAMVTIDKNPVLLDVYHSLKFSDYSTRAINYRNRIDKINETQETKDRIKTEARGDLTTRPPSSFFGVSGGDEVRAKTIGQVKDFFSYVENNRTYIMAADAEQSDGTRVDIHTAHDAKDSDKNPLWVDAERAGWTEHPDRVTDVRVTSFYYTADGESKKHEAVSLTLIREDPTDTELTLFIKVRATPDAPVAWHRLNDLEGWTQTKPPKGDDDKDLQVTDRSPISTREDGSKYQTVVWSDGSETTWEVSPAPTVEEKESEDWAGLLAQAVNADKTTPVSDAASILLSNLESLEKIQPKFQGLPIAEKRRIVMTAWNLSWQRTLSSTAEGRADLANNGFGTEVVVDGQTLSQGHLNLLASAEVHFNMEGLAFRTAPVTAVPAVPAVSAVPESLEEAPGPRVPTVAVEAPGSLEEAPGPRTTVVPVAPDLTVGTTLGRATFTRLQDAAINVIEAWKARIGDPNEELTGEQAETRFLPYLTNLMREIVSDPDDFAKNEDEYVNLVRSFAGFTMAEAQRTLENFVARRAASKESAATERHRVYDRAVKEENVRETRVRNQRAEGLSMRQHVSQVQAAQKEAILGVHKAMATAQQAIARDYLDTAAAFGPLSPGAKVGGAASYERIAEALGVPKPDYLPIGAPVPDLPQTADIQAFQEALAEARKKIQYGTVEEQEQGLAKRQEIALP